MRWGAWQQSDRLGENIYADWDLHFGGSDSIVKRPDAEDPGRNAFVSVDIGGSFTSAFQFQPQSAAVFLTSPDGPRLQNLQRFRAPESRGQIDKRSPLSDAASAQRSFEMTREQYGGIETPSFMSNKTLFEEFVPSGRPEVPDDLPVLPLNTVIVGVVDTGIALGHRATRLANGDTRIVAAWQQSADISDLPNPPGPEDQPDMDEKYRQEYLPFGREYYQSDINAALARHSDGNREQGWLDEDAFNRELSLVDFANPRGHRALSMRHAHGTHVLARAAGYDPVEESEMSKRTRIIAVNLPSREVVGLSGTYLERYVIAGIARIVKLADALWQKAVEDAAEKQANGEDISTADAERLEQIEQNSQKSGFPIVINFSFGKQAGPKDGTDPIAALMDSLNANRGKLSGNFNALELYDAFLVSPSGNDNLTRSNALVYLDPHRTAADEYELPLRILPEDQSSNYVEIWTDPIPGTHANDADLPLQISVSLPGDDGYRDFTPAKDKQVREIANARQTARLYADAIPHVNDDGARSYRIRYTLCTAPTLLQEPQARQVAPAGLWRIRLRQTLDTPIKVTCMAQADQSILPGGATGRRPYFDQEAYQRHDETTGRAIDTFSYTYDDAEPTDLDPAEGVRRHGTLNSAAIHRTYTAVTGGHRASDGKPADYASTGRAEGRGQNRKGIYHHDGMAAPTISLVTDDGAAYPGILSSGARDGSTVAMQGTSFAASQFTRLYSRHLLDDPDLNPKEFARLATDPAFRGQAGSGYPGEANTGKKGLGRLPVQHYRNLNRRGAVDD